MIIRRSWRKPFAVFIAFTIFSIFMFWNAFDERTYSDYYWMYETGARQIARLKRGAWMSLAPPILVLAQVLYALFKPIGLVLRDGALYMPGRSGFQLSEVRRITVYNAEIAAEIHLDGAASSFTGSSETMSLSTWNYAIGVRELTALLEAETGVTADWVRKKGLR